MVLGSRITRYVTMRTLISVGSALLVLSSIIVLANFVEVSRSLGARAEATAGQLFGLALLESPGTILVIMPFAFLFGVLIAFVALNRRSELIALRAAGVSAWRFVTPAALMAALIGVLSAVALNPIAAFTTDQFERFKAELTPGGGLAGKTIWLRQGDKRNQIIIRAESNQGPGVHLKSVSLFENRVEPNGQLSFVRRIEASDAVLKKATWTLTNAKEFLPGAVGGAVGTVQLHSTLNERNTLERLSTTATVPAPLWALPALIARTEAAGISPTVYRLQLQQLLSTPLMYAAMSVLAAAFSLRLLRLGGLAQFAGAGVGLGFIFFFFNQLCSAFGKSDVLPPVLAAWAPPAIALLLGITLLCYTEDG